MHRAAFAEVVVRRTCKRAPQDVCRKVFRVMATSMWERAPEGVCRKVPEGMTTIVSTWERAPDDVCRKACSGGRPASPSNRAILLALVEASKGGDPHKRHLPLTCTQATLQHTQRLTQISF